jgi:hypothetical protein
MNSYESEAYAKGQADAIASREQGHIDQDDDFQNPYRHGSEDWQAWNLGWNNEILQNG